jgi:hypothetical protein
VAGWQTFLTKYFDRINGMHFNIFQVKKQHFGQTALEIPLTSFVCVVYCSLPKMLFFY